MANPGPAKAAYVILEREYYGNRTLTENAAGAFTTTGDQCLNFFATVVRSTSTSTILQDFVDAWNEDPNKAVKLNLNLRDIRGGKGEKKLPLTLMYALSCWKPLTYLANLQNFMKLGCYKDFLVISELAVRCAHIPNFKRLPQLGDGLELALMAAQLNQDEKDMDEVIEGDKKAGISLCAKWAPTEMTHYDQLPLRFSRKITKSMGIKKSEYRKKLSKLRQHLAVLERLMCMGKFDEIIFKSLPAKAPTAPRSLQARYECEEGNLHGKETIKATGTQPHELIKPYVDGQYCSGRYRDSDSDEEADHETEKDKVDATIEGQWKALVAELAKTGSFRNCQAVCDVSGSMNGKPMQVAVALGLVVAELTEEPFHNQLITFSATPTLHDIKGSTLRDRVLDVMDMEWGANTNLLAVFDLLLNKVAENPSAKMVESLFVFTDMQFDQASCGYGWSTTYQSICEKYAAQNVKVPQIVFWNLRATHKSFPVEKTQEGTALVSGFSAQLMKAFMDAKLEDFNPLSIMNSTLDKYTIVEVHRAEKFPIEAGESWTQSFEDVEKVVQEFLVPKKKKTGAPLKDTYPNTIPDITVRNEFETSTENVEAVSSLQEDLITSAEKMLGSPMLLQLAKQVSSWLETEPRKFFSKSSDERETNQEEGPSNSTGRVKVPSSSSDSDEDAKLPPLRTATDVVSRILWDKQLNSACVTVGYLDRFTGLTEAKFSEFCWDQPISAVDNDTLAIPRHRIQYFKYRDVKIWDKNERLDLVFGSTGSEARLHDLVKDMGDSEPAKADDQERDRWAIEGLEDDVDIDCDSIIEGMKEYKNVNRPNFFFGIRTTDQDIRAKAESITEKIITSDPRLSACALSSNCFHITLATLRLDGEPQIRNAIHLLKNLQPAIKDQFPEPIVLTLDKLDHFYGNVLYAKVQHNPELMRFAEFIRGGIQSGGVRIVDIHSFSPHMTIMKINRPTQRQYGLPRTIDSFLYQPFKNEYFGEQTVSELFLCPIAADRQDDGFYQTVMEMSV